MSVSKPHSVQDSCELIADAINYPICHPALKEAFDHVESTVEQLETLRAYIRALETDLNAAGDENHRLREHLREVVQETGEGHIWNIADAALVPVSNPATSPKEIAGLQGQYGRLRLAAEAVLRTERDSGTGGVYVNSGDMENLRAVLNPASVYEGTPKPHGIDCRCSECSPASSPTYHVPEEHGRFPAVGMTAPDPASRPPADATPFEKPRMQQIGESLPASERQ